MERLKWVLLFTKAIFLDLYQSAYRFVSRKIIISVLGVMAISQAFAEAKKSNLSESVIVWSLPIAIICITLIVVTYVTGQAKIDIQANVQGPK